MEIVLVIVILRLFYFGLLNLFRFQYNLLFDGRLLVFVSTEWKVFIEIFILTLLFLNYNVSVKFLSSFDQLIIVVVLLVIRFNFLLL